VTNEKIKYANELLQQIAAGVNQLSGKHRYLSLAAVEVALVNGDDKEFTVDLATALDYLANDIYWNEDGDWSDARIARVRVI